MATVYVIKSKRAKKYLKLGADGENELTRDTAEAAQFGNEATAGVLAARYLVNGYSIEAVEV